MIRMLHFLALLLISIHIFAQSPQKMSYQAVIRNTQNELLANKPVKMRISILQGSESGNAVYSELHSATTNANGLVSIEIGGGTSPQGTFSSINWGNGTYFLKTETDPNNGANYSIEGTSQLLSVPYALESKKSETAKNAGNGIKAVSKTGDTVYLDNGQKYIVPGISYANNDSNYGSVSDVSGNTYPTLKIGTQTWMVENLRTTKYRDKSDIPVVTDNTQWRDNYNNSTTLPMMGWYNNDSTTYKANKLGALYNWYAVASLKQLCPSGWHVPTDAEWTTLSDFLGGITVAGGKMKSVGMDFWASPNTEATNISGFSGYGGGYRALDGNFYYFGSFGYWWSSTSPNFGNALARGLRNINGNVLRENKFCALGYSVRCIKD